MSLFQHEREGNAQELIGALRRAESEAVRRRAAEALGRLDDHEDRHDIVRALVRTAEEEDGRVAAAAVDALDRQGGDALERLLASATGVDLDDGADWVKARAFVRALDAEVPELRMAAANALGDLGHSEAVPALAERFDDPDPRVRARAARACGQIADPRATAPLESLLSDPSVGVRREGAEALGRIGTRRALSALLELYDDEDERVRRIAVGAFGNFDTDRPVDHLVGALGDRSPAVRRTAVYALVELLSNVPTDASHRIRETVVERLAETDDRTVVGPLVEILRESTQASQRRNTAWLLGRVTDDPDNRAAIDALVGALEDGEGTTRRFAATSLAEIGGSYAETRLLAVVEDDAADADVRGQAAFALGKIGGRETVERLRRLLDATDDEQVRQRAFAALSKLGGHAGDGP